MADSDTDQTELIYRSIAERPEGLSLSELSENLSIPKRTLQRRIERLIQEKRIERHGRSRALRYRITALGSESNVVAVNKSWLSPAALDIRRSVSNPLTSRTPVGYQSSFLERYRPNVTHYLPEALKGELSQLGEVGLSGLPAGTYLRQVLNRLLIDLSWNSSRLEGNTYSLLETEALLERNETAEGKPAEETQMILNHKAAIELMSDQAAEIGFNRYTVCNLHALLSDNLLADPGAGGRLRSRAVGIGGSVFRPLDVPQQIEEEFLQILGKAEAIRHPLEQAFFVMVHLPYLQPFEDVNKRVSRLAANIPMIRHNLCPLSFVDVEQSDYVGGLLGVYELNRIEYLRDVFAWAYRRSCARFATVRQSLGEPDPFRLRYRGVIGRMVSEIIRNRLNKSQAARWIASEAAREVGDPDRARLINVVETELANLHPGNFARYRVRPSEFEEWSAIWNDR